MSFTLGVLILDQILTHFISFMRYEGFMKKAKFQFHLVSQNKERYGL